MPVVAFRVYALAAAWGLPGRGADTRPVSIRPGRGHILGLLGAAQGWDFNDPRYLRLQEVSVASATHGRQRKENDYRAAQDVWDDGVSPYSMRVHTEKRSQKVGNRGFVTDTAWRVFAHVGDPAEAEAFASALRYPVFPLCAGRQEFPLALSTMPVVYSGGLQDALAYSLIHPSEVEGVGHISRCFRHLRRMFEGNFDLHWDVGFPGAPDDGSVRQISDDPIRAADGRRIGWTFRAREEAHRRMTATSANAADFFHSMTEDADVCE